jgi:oxygen-independent coproporphyrinogen-3 oxidase
MLFLRQMKPINKFIDVEKVISEKNPALIKFLPRFIINYIKKKLHEDFINQGIENNQPAFDFELLTKENQFNELLLTGLRAKWGVSLAQLGAILPLDKSFLQQLENLEKKGWVVCNENTVYLTQEGKSWADKIAQDLFV